MSETKTEPRPVTLSDGSVLVFDVENGYYRIVYYRRRKSGDGLASISASKFDDLVRRRILPRGYHTQWTRTVTLDTNLLDGLRELMRIARHSQEWADETYRYIRSMPWGERLP